MICLDFGPTFLSVHSRSLRCKEATEPVRSENAAHDVTTMTSEGASTVKLKAFAGSAFALAAITGMGTAGATTASATSAPVKDIPSYQHIVEIMMENTSYGTIIGNPNAPNINTLASQYGLATDYFGVTHPSEPNYMTNIAGDYFGVQDDNQFYCTPAVASTDPHCTGTTVNHTIDVPTLADQLTAAGKTWKGYFQSLPPSPPPGDLITSGPNANGPYTFKYPSDSRALYASKHNPFLNFTGTQGALANMVPDTKLAADLAGTDCRTSASSSRTSATTCTARAAART
jgi:hypothetical protein